MKCEHRFPWLVLFLMLTVTLFAACSDGMTDPDVEAPSAAHRDVGAGDIGDATPHECTGSAATGYTCEGIEGGGGCNQADAFQSCHGQGGGSYGGGSGGGTGGTGGDGGGGGSGSTGDSGDSSSPAPLSNDFVPDTIKPNCASPASGMETAVCTAKTPEPGTIRRQRTEDALRRILARGGPCGAIAQRGFELLEQMRLGYFPPQSGLAGGYGNAGFGAVLQEDWVDRFHDKRDLDGRNLDFVLVHEIEHQMGHYHPNGQPEGNTPNDAACS